MRIVSYEEFIELPSGTMYCETEPCFFGALKIKGDTINDGKDWFLIPLVDNLDNPEDYDKAKKEDVPFDFTTSERDGMFDYNREFAIYSTEDIEQFIKALEKLL